MTKGKLKTQHEQTYMIFRTRCIAEHRGAFDEKDIDIFRNLLLQMVAYNATKDRYTPKIQDIQMASEFCLSTLQQRDIQLPPTFAQDGKQIQKEDHYEYLYQIYLNIQKDQNKTNFCFMLPYFGFYQTRYIPIKEDVPRLERYAFTFWNYPQGSQTKMIDIVYDYVEVSEALRSQIAYAFSDITSRSEYVIDRTMTLIREIAVCWACSMLNRTQLEDADQNHLVNQCFTDHISKYREIASKP